MKIDLEVPDSLFKKAAEFAARDRVTVEQLLTSALAEKISAYMTEEYLAGEGPKVSREEFMQILANAPDVEPEDHDRL